MQTLEKEVHNPSWGEITVHIVNSDVREKSS